LTNGSGFRRLALIRSQNEEGRGGFASAPDSMALSFLFHKVAASLPDQKLIGFPEKIVLCSAYQKD
jgi:hypothetical protein